MSAASECMAKVCGGQEPSAIPPPPPGSSSSIAGRGMVLRRHELATVLWAALVLASCDGGESHEGTPGASANGGTGRGAGGAGGSLPARTDAAGPDAPGADANASDSRAADAAAADSGSTGPRDALAPVDASSAGEGGAACVRPSADQPWIRSYQDDLVARLAGARPLPSGGMLGVRASAAARSATRSFLIDQFREIGYVAELHDYGSGQNVQAVLPATSGGGETVLFGAHFDTVAGSPGANDNATGVAAVYATARYLSTLPCRGRRVIFVLFDEEERGRIGSLAYARKLRDEGARVHSVHTIDQMGWDMDGDRRIEVELPDTGLRELYVAAATDLGWSTPSAAIARTNVSSTDHASFRPAFPAIGLTEEFRGGDTSPHYHQPGDTHATVNFDYLRNSTILIHHVFADLVSVTPLFAHRVPAPQVVLRRPSEVDNVSRLRH